MSKNLFILHDDSLLNPEINEILDTKKKKKIEFNLFKVKKEYRKQGLKETNSRHAERMFGRKFGEECGAISER